MMDDKKITRRVFGQLTAGASFAGALGVGSAHGLTRNISAFAPKDWRGFFDDTQNGVVLVDTKTRVLHFWGQDEATYRIYPTSVPSTPELTRLGRTKIVRRRVGPDWSPTPEMLKRNPEWPAYIQDRKSVGHARVVFKLDVLSYSRHPRYAKDWAAVVKRLYWVV